MKERLAGALGATSILGIAAVASFSMYRHTLGYGFDYDDYHFIRPYSADEILAAFHGPWDPAGIEVPFFRPLTIAFYAARFELFGVDSEAHHRVSLALFAAAGFLTGLFAWSATRRLTVGVAAATVFLLHPAMPYALVAWITNQMHLIETIVVLMALLWWFVCRGRRVGWWLPLLLFGAAAFMIKEDGVMLLPGIIVLHWLRRRTVEPSLQTVPRLFVLASLALIAGLILLRADALEGLGGYGFPTIERAWANYRLGLDRVFRLVPPDRPWQQAASLFATLLPIAGLMALPRAHPPTRFLFAAGALLALAFNLPFVFVSKNEQMHLVTMGAVLVLTASAAAILEATPRRGVRIVSAAIIAAGFASFASVARHISTDFAPFGPIVLSHDDLVKDWAAVPQELREYLRRKLEPGAAGTLSPNPAEAIRLIAFGLHGKEETPDGLTFRWMAEPRIELHVGAGVRRIDIPLRHEIGAFRDPVPVEVEVDGRKADALVISDAEWRTRRIGLPQKPRTGRMHKVRLKIPRTWRPSEVIPESKDDRLLGLQVGRIEVY